MYFRRQIIVESFPRPGVAFLSIMLFFAGVASKAALKRSLIQC